MILFLLIVALEPSSAPQREMRISVSDVLDRIDKFDPSVKGKAYEQLRAEVLLRRAKWNQVNGGVGVSAGYGIYGSTIGPSLAPDTLAQSGVPANLFFDRVTANLAANLTYPIYAGGAIQGGIDAAQARLDSAKWDLRTVTRDLKRSALVSFSALIAAERQVSIAEFALARSEAVSDIAERRKNSGISTEADVARAALNRLRRAEDVESRLGDRAIAEATLRAALVLEPDLHLVPVGEIQNVRELGARRENEDRLEIYSLRLQVDAAVQDRRVAFGGWLPRLEAFGSFTYGNGQPFFIGGTAQNLGSAINRFGYLSGSLQAGLRLSWTGWDFFITRDAVARADADIAIAQMRLAEQERTAQRELGEAVARLQQAERRLGALSGSREVAEKAVRLARVRYETGNAVLTEVLDAELEAIAVESRKVQADYDATAAHLDRLRAEGAEL